MQGTTRASGPATRGAPGRIGMLWIGLWTVFLAEPLAAAWDARGTVAGSLGLLALLAFWGWYLWTAWFLRRWLIADGAERSPSARWTVLGVALALSVTVCATLGQEGTPTAVYVCVLAVMGLRQPRSLLAAVVIAGAYYAGGHLVPDWRPDHGLLLSSLAASVAVFGITQMVRGNAELRAATDENRRLAVVDERNRFARDLHDILGHSLTVITVKAELAGRLLDDDAPAARARARAEVADLERLSREALTDVRRAVEGYRDLTLPGELSRARRALEAAGVEPDLPGSTEQVPGELRELFAWTVREAVTNVVRHSRATHCRVVLTPTSVEVVDDGVGPGAAVAAGSGLDGLRERARQAGATLLTGPAHPGFRLRMVAGP